MRVSRHLALHTPSALLVALFLGFPAALAGQAAQAAHPSEPERPSLLSVDEETALALEAAPPHLRAGAGVYVLRDSGLVRLRPSTNGFTCAVNRDHPRAIKPTCWDAEGTRTILPAVVHVSGLLMRGVPVAQIERDVAERFRRGEFESPKRPGVAYMLSPRIRNVDHRTGAERGFPPHVMFYAPDLTDADIGAAQNVAPGLPFIDYQGPHGYMIVMPHQP